MVGPECTILSTGNLNSASDRVAAVSSNGYYLTYGGQQISFGDQTGAFLLFKSTTLGVEIHVYQTSCHVGSCVAAVSLQTSTTSIVIAPAGQGFAPRVYKDGVLITLDDLINTFSTQMTVTHPSLTEISITVTTIGTIQFKTLVQEQYLQASVLTSTSVCSASTGIFGNCSGSSMDYSSMTDADITIHMISNYYLYTSIILDTLGAPAGNNVSFTGYALDFNNTASATLPIAYPSGFNISNQDFSISLYFKPINTEGYIVSTGKDKTFSVMNTNPIRLVCDNSFVDTSKTAELGVWNQIVLTFRRSTQQVDFFHFGSGSRVTHEVLSFGCDNIFEVGGTVSLGEYTPSTGSSIYTFTSTHFIGQIDEMSIWRNPIPNDMIYQAHLLNLKVSGFASELALSYSFTAGVGVVAFEQINGINMVLPESPWQSPTWVVSDLGLEALRTGVNEVYDTSTDPAVETVCGTFFDNTAVSSNCGGISGDVLWWYKQICIITASNTGNVSDSTMAMVDFTTLCDVTGSTVTALYDIICGLSINLPGWLSQKCSSCSFGFTNSNGSCTCYYGYWGSQCASVCPGGVASPCSGHGTCDVGGSCQCTGRWAGSDCSSCETGWSGVECTILQTSYVPLVNGTTNLVAQANLIGQIANFDGIIVDILWTGYYTLLQITSLDISLVGRFTVCDATTSLHMCMSGFIIRHGGQQYYISHDTYTGTSVTLLTSVTTHTLYSTLTLGSITVKLVSPTTIECTVSGSDLTIRLVSISSRLIVTVSIPQTEWNSRSSELSGVWTSCATDVAITAAACTSVTRSDICSNVLLDVPDHCELTQTRDALYTYLQNHIYTDTAFQAIIEQNYLSPMTSNCFLFAGVGVSSTITLPEDDFTFEVHVKPTNTEGILLCYSQNGIYFIVINSPTGLLIAYHSTSLAFHTTGLILTQNDWNQINFAWRYSFNIMEVYLLSSTGSATVKAVSLPSTIFVKTGGTLTLGQITPGLSVAISMGTFTGYIDEVRIWTRPHNPTIIVQNFRVVVTTETSDVSYSWNFNEGLGLIGYDMNKAENMLVVDSSNPPTWTTSDLDLTDYTTLDVPQLTTLDEQNAAEVAATTTTCTNLLSTFSLSVTGSSVELLTDVYQALCIMETTSSGDVAQIAAVLASVAEMFLGENSTTNPLTASCNDLPSLLGYIGAGGSSCITCNFGTVINGTCVCIDSHWGTSCDTICPVGALGGCNTFGTCTSTGSCHCHARHQGAGFTVQIYWQSYIGVTTPSTAVTYTCETCSDNWYGQYCEYGHTAPVSGYSVGIVYGSYITTLDGISFLHVAAGVFSLIHTGSVEVQVLFIPCLGYSNCRYIQEVAIRDGSEMIYIQHISTSSMTVHANSTQISYPTEATFDPFTVSWNKTELFIRILFGDSSVLIHNSDVGLVLHARMGPAESSSNTGLLGNTDGTWTNDVNCQTGTVITNANLITSAYSVPCVRSRYSVPQSDIFIVHTHGLDPPTSAGYQLQLTNQDVTMSSLTAHTRLSTLTVTFWSMSVSTSTSYTILEINTGTNILQFQVNNGFLILNWDNTYNTTLTYTQNEWHYIALSWSRNSFSNVFIIKDSTTTSQGFSEMHSTATLDIQGLTVIGTTTSTVSVDLVRAWSSQKSLKDILTDMEAYPGDVTDNNLLMILPLDEGTGSSVTLNMYSQGQSLASVTGTISGTMTATTWLPSTIPIPDILSPETLTSTDGTNYTAAVTDCMAILSHPNITEHCPDVVSSAVSDHLLEACIREYSRGNTDNATDILFTSLLVFCEGALGVSSCLYVGYIDFECVEEESSSSGGGGFPIAIIGAAVGLLLLLAVIAFIVRRKCCSPKAGAGKTDDHDELLENRPVSNMRFRPDRIVTPDIETSFSRPVSVAWSEDGRRSTDTIDSRVLNSPISFIDDPDSRLSFYMSSTEPTPGDSQTQPGQSSTDPLESSSDPPETVSPVYHPTPKPAVNSGHTWAGSPMNTPVPAFGALAPTHFNKNQNNGRNKMFVTPTETPQPAVGAGASTKMTWKQLPFGVRKTPFVYESPNTATPQGRRPSASSLIDGQSDPSSPTAGHTDGTWKQLPFPVRKIPKTPEPIQVPYTSGTPVTVTTPEPKGNGTWNQLPFPVPKTPRTHSSLSRGSVSRASTQTDISLSEDLIQPPN